MIPTFSALKLHQSFFFLHHHHEFSLIPNKHHNHCNKMKSIKASDPDTEPETKSTSPPEQEQTDQEFESRLSQIRLKYKSGSGKKAEMRKARKSGGGSKKNGSAAVFLPPVPLKEPISGGLKVEFGWSQYTERLNGTVAAIGLGALLAVELYTGKSLLGYHDAPILFLQVYFVTSLMALLIKYDKEKVSIWPESKSQ